MTVDCRNGSDRKERTATSYKGKHVGDVMQQVLFTRSGERVNRPKFGCGVGQVVLEPNSQEVAAAAQFLVHVSLQS